MPYYIHAPGTFPHPMSDTTATRADAYQLLKSTDRVFWSITFAPSADDTDTWTERENARFRGSRYLKTPWHNDDWYRSGSYDGTSFETYLPSLRQRHYAHISRTQPGMIAFTETPEKGVQDRHTRVTPGRYLERFAPKDLSIEDRQAYIDAVKEQAGAKYQIATTADDIVAVYKHGPSSCMSGSKFEARNHPCRVYGDSDLAVAYLGDLENQDVRARCVVRPGNKQFTRVYGDTLLEHLLRHDDWTHTDDLSGARIRRIEGRNGWLMPYIDAAESASYHSDTYWTLSDGAGDVSTREACGYVEAEPDEPETFECTHCERERPNDEYNESGCCDRCEGHRNYCNGCEEDTWDDGESVNGHFYCSVCLENMAHECPECSETWYDVQVSGATITRERNLYSVSDYCPSCADDHLVCDSCDTYQDRDNEFCENTDCAERLRACRDTLPLPFDPTKWANYAIGDGLAWGMVQDRAIKVSESYLYWLGDDGRMMMTYIPPHPSNFSVDSMHAVVVTNEERNIAFTAFASTPFASTREVSTHV